MKLCISCLLVTFAWVLAAPSPAPAPRPDGPMETMFNFLAGIPQAMVSQTNNLLRCIPFLNMIPRVMQSGLNIGENIAENMDYILGLDGDRRRQRNDSNSRSGGSDRSGRSNRTN